jgi:hypothetical protein
VRSPIVVGCGLRACRSAAPCVSCCVLVVALRASTDRGATGILARSVARVPAHGRKTPPLTGHYCQFVGKIPSRCGVLWSLDGGFVVFGRCYRRLRRLFRRSCGNGSTPVCRASNAPSCRVGCRTTTGASGSGNARVQGIEPAEISSSTLPRGTPRIGPMVTLRVIAAVATARVASSQSVTAGNGMELPSTRLRAFRTIAA